MVINNTVQYFLLSLNEIIECHEFFDRVGDEALRKWASKECRYHMAIDPAKETLFVSYRSASNVLDHHFHDVRSKANDRYFPLVSTDDDEHQGKIEVLMLEDTISKLTKMRNWLYAYGSPNDNFIIQHSKHSGSWINMRIICYRRGKVAFESHQYILYNDDDVL